MENQSTAAVGTPNRDHSDTSNFLDWVEIKNFKSIKDLRLDCKRVNIFIGKPNVGKSNILEALGLLGVRGGEDQKYMNGSIRYNTIDQLFFDGDNSDKLTINTNLLKGELGLLDGPNISLGNSYQFHWYINRPVAQADKKLHRSISLSEEGIIKSTSAGSFTVREDRDSFTVFLDSPVKKYDFANETSFKIIFNKYLLPPSGSNLYEIVNRNKNIWSDFYKLFNEQNLEFILSDTDKTFVLQKKEGYRAKQYPFFSIADTFRRFMFYIAAIESNTNSVLVFEEPEVHSFPPYVQDIAYRMIYSETNQFFVSTHSPYLLQTLVENLSDDQLQLFVTYYENHETKVKALTADELAFVQEYSADVFFNLDRFIPNAHPAATT